MRRRNGGRIPAGSYSSGRRRSPGRALLIPDSPSPHVGLINQAADADEGKGVGRGKGASCAGLADRVLRGGRRLVPARPRRAPDRSTRHGPTLPLAGGADERRNVHLGRDALGLRRSDGLRPVGVRPDLWSSFGRPSAFGVVADPRRTRSTPAVGDSLRPTDGLRPWGAARSSTPPPRASPSGRLPGESRIEQHSERPFHAEALCASGVGSPAGATEGGNRGVFRDLPERTSREAAPSRTPPHPGPGPGCRSSRRRWGPPRRAPSRRRPP